MTYLEEQKIHTIGTFRRNRFPGITSSDDKTIMKKARKTSEEVLEFTMTYP